MANHASSPKLVEEAEPLLSPIEPRVPPVEVTQAITTKAHKPWILLVVLLVLVIAIVDVGAFLAEPPKTRVYEANICLHYYAANNVSAISPNGTVPEALCKIDPVHQQLAMIFGWQDTFDAIPGLILAVPLGALADTIGRKWIFAVSALGLQLNYAWILLICYFKSLPLQLTWFSSVFYFIGGGPIVAIAIGITMLSDIVPPEKRTTIFLFVTASALVAETVAPAISATMMTHGDWLPLMLAFFIQFIGVSIAALMPESLHLRDIPEPTETVEAAIELHPKRSRYSLVAQVRHFKDAVVFLKSDTQMMLIIFTFLALRLGRQGISLLIRYASKRYGWEYGKAAYLLSFRAAANLVAVTIFIPAANLVLLKKVRLLPQWADLWLARGSILITSIAFFIMGIAAHPALLIIGLLIFNLGTGYSAAMRSVAIHTVGGQSSPNVGKLMSLLAITESLGLMVGGPMINGFLRLGMHIGSVWTGLPYLVTCVINIVITVVTFKITVDAKGVSYAQVAQDYQDDTGEAEPREL